MNYSPDDLTPSQNHFLQAMNGLYARADGEAIMSEALAYARKQVTAEVNRVVKNHGWRIKPGLGPVDKADTVEFMALTLTTYQSMARDFTAAERFHRLLATWDQPQTFARSYMDLGEDGPLPVNDVVLVTSKDIRNFTPIDWSKSPMDNAIAAVRHRTKLNCFENNGANPASLIEMVINGVDAALAKRGAAQAERNKISQELSEALPDLVAKDALKVLREKIARLPQDAFSEKIELAKEVISRAKSGKEKNYLKTVAALFTQQGEGFVNNVMARINTRLNEIHDQVRNDLFPQVKDKKLQFPASAPEVALMAFEDFAGRFGRMFADSNATFGNLITWAIDTRGFGMMGFDNSAMNSVAPYGSQNTVFYELDTPVSQVWVREAKDVAKAILVPGVVPTPKGLAAKTSLAEIINSAVIDELRIIKTGDKAERQIAAVEKRLCQPFPRLEAMRQSRCQKKEKPATAEIFPKYNFESNAKYLTLLTNRQRNARAVETGIDEFTTAKTSDLQFDLPEARSLISIRSPESVATTAAESRFMLSTRYINGIHSLADKFNNLKNEKLRGEMDLLLSDQNMARLVHHSGLNVDFPEVRAPKLGKNKAQSISPEMAKLLLDADATFLIAAHRNDQPALKKLADSVTQIATTGQSFGFHYLNRQARQTAEALAFPHAAKGAQG